MTNRLLTLPAPGVGARSSRRTFAVGAAALASIATVTAPGRAAQFELKCGTSDAAIEPRSIRLGQMWGAVERESGGRIQIKFFPGSSLGSEDSMFSQLRLGVLHFQMTSPGVLSSLVLPWSVAYLGFTYKNMDEGARAINGPLGNYLRQEANVKGLTVFRGIWQTGMGHIFSSTHPIRTPDDLKGFKLRTATNKIAVDFFRILGASPTPLTYAEVYPALQTKLVDGVTSALQVAEAARWYEVLRYCSLTSHLWYSNYVVANGDMWKSLPPDLQAIIERNVIKYSAMASKDVVDSSNALYHKMETEQHIAFNTLDQAPFQARIGPYYRDWQATFGPNVWNMLTASLGHQLGTNA